MTLLPAIAAKLERLEPAVEQLPAARRERLDELVEFIRLRHEAGLPVRITFVCTHNSRRSHFGQLWAAAAARYHGVEGVSTFSGGTEVTAFNPRAIAALQRAGFEVVDPGGDNPRYLVSFATDRPREVCFSKKLDDAHNPQDDFGAVMTCAEADAACPVVSGAVARISLPYDDPKAFDGSELESAKYDERSEQIATEMLYVFSRSRTPHAR